MASTSQKFRLTADNYSEENLEYILKETQGLLGAYEIREFEDLREVMSDDFVVEWRAAKMDPNAGLLKLRPQTNNGKRRLDRARALPLVQRHPGLSMYHAVGVVQVTKRYREAKEPIIQDFLLRHYDNEALHAHIEADDLDRFREHITTKMRDDFTKKQIETIFELLPQIQKVMYRDPKKKAQEKQATQDTEDGSNAAEEAEASSEEHARGETENVHRVDESPYTTGEELEAAAEENAIGSHRHVGEHEHATLVHSDTNEAGVTTSAAGDFDEGQPQAEAMGPVQ